MVDAAMSDEANYPSWRFFAGIILGAPVFLLINLSFSPCDLHVDDIITKPPECNPVLTKVYIYSRIDAIMR